MLRQEMTRSSVDRTVIQKLLQILAKHTTVGWQHLFVTTNWDYLLQHEIERLELAVQPPWMANSHVFHVNGTVEILPDNSNRSQFLLEEDSAVRRHFAPEANIAYNHMIWGQTFIVVGLSFECATDRFLLRALNRVEDDLPIGESTWFLLNPDMSALEESGGRISRALPHADVKLVQRTFGAWLDDGFPELCAHGVLDF